MRTFLVTGGLGFIGRALTEELASAGHRVRVLDAVIEQVHGGAEPPELVRRGAVELVRGDIRDPEAVGRAVAGVDGVFHLAAEVGVGQSMYEIARYVGVNDLGTAVLLQALIDRPVQRIVVASSMSVYGEGRYLLPDGSRAEGGAAQSGAGAARALGSGRPGRRAARPGSDRRGEAGRSRLDLRADQVRAGARGADLRRGLRGRGGGAPALQRLRAGAGARQPLHRGAGELRRRGSRTGGRRRSSRTASSGATSCT